MDLKHVLMQLGLKYLREAGGRIVIHKEALQTKRPLIESIQGTRVVDVGDNFVAITLGKGL